MRDALSLCGCLFVFVVVYVCLLWLFLECVLCVALCVVGVKCVLCVFYM